MKKSSPLADIMLPERKEEDEEGRKEMQNRRRMENNTNYQMMNNKQLTWMRYLRYSLHDNPVMHAIFYKAYNIDFIYKQNIDLLFHSFFVKK